MYLWNQKLDFELFGRYASYGRAYGFLVFLFQISWVECSSCGALYTTDYCCSEGSLGDKIICDLDKTLDLFQEPPQNCPKCGNPVDGQYCQGCALLRKKFKENLFTYCIENGILQDSSEPSNNNTNVVNALQEPFVVNQDPGENSSQSPPQINHHCCYGCGDPLKDNFCHQCTCELCGKGAHYGYNCPPKVLIIPDPDPFNNQTIDELPQTFLSFDPTCYSKEAIAITFDLPTMEPEHSLRIRDEHLDTILETESDEFIKSSVENLVSNPSVSNDLSNSECDMPACDDFTTFSNLLFDVDDDFSSSDDNNSLIEEINLSLTLNDSMPPGIKDDDYDSERDMFILEELLSNDSLSLPENESFHFDIPSSPRPPAKPPDDDEIEPNLGMLTVKVVGDISKQYVPISRLLPTQPTLVSNQEKSPHLLSHQGLKAFQVPSKSPMMIYGRNIPILDVPFLHFYPP
nr:hypothetical protein [Tanacetum cinerariifolium]